VIPFTLAEIASLTEGRLSDLADPDVRVTGPVIADSRTVVPGALFVALPGERVDGHDFAAGAVASGAVAVLAARDVGVPAVLVPDPLTALGTLARAVLDRLRDTVTVIAVTGSVGKTTTKDLVAALLARQGPTVAPPGSFNNELGLPLTVAQVGTDTRFAVAEMGARGPGHIRYLCRIAPPRIGVVLNVGSAHAGEFGGREATARAKGELVEELPADGVAVLNADDPLVRAMADRTRARVVLVGTGPESQIRAERIRVDDFARASFRLCTPRGDAEVGLRLAGEHQVSNALAAAAVALETGMSVSAVAEELGRIDSVSRWRMEITERSDGVVVVNDSYNANPESMKAALTASAAIAGRSRRLWAVLGEMLELGEGSGDDHVRIGALAREVGVDRLIAVGPGGLPYAEGFSTGYARTVGLGPEPPVWRVADGGSALEVLRARLEPGDVVVIKASRAVRLDRVAEQLLDNPSTDEDKSSPRSASAEEVAP
jgi:UDP-N-acetylmuramoyl-tripeptide--D-alanyl-D-alanine ligase